jgi:prepilin-type N-terminal cleavage/methylation domain-containing protein
MKKNNQSGFSLIELLLVVTIIGVISAIGVPSLRKGIKAADNGSTFATMRTMATTQVGYYSSNGRFARLSELNNILQSLGSPSGSPSGTSFTRGRFLLEMSPMTPTDAQLKIGYIITATGPSDGGTPYVFKVSQTGEIVQITP